MSYDSAEEQQGWLTYRVGQGVLIEDGRVLLAGNRWYAAKPLVWTLPGGRASEGEGIVEALVREFREETGLEVEAGRLAFVAESRSILRRRLFLVCAFAVRRLGGELTCEGDPAVEELRFVPFGELGVYLPSASLGNPIRNYVAGVDAPPRYWFFPEYSAD
jgi:ADP-ribose pyrophosphatase YjhB (NUDIX family)